MIERYNTSCDNVKKTQSLRTSGQSINSRKLTTMERALYMALGRMMAYKEMMTFKRGRR